MRRFAVAIACGLFVLALEPRTSTAQTAAPATLAVETEPFSGPELLAGKRMTEAECAMLPGAVWVLVESQGDCIRYYFSQAGGGGSEVMVYVSGDVIATNARREQQPVASYLKATPASMQNASVAISRHFRMPYLLLARPGTYGSSGNHSERRGSREIALVSAALDAIKSRHEFTRLHLVGFSQAGHTAAALLARRTDLGCVALASPLVAVQSRLAEFGLKEDVTGNKKPIDPIALVDQVVKRSDLRILVLTDPDDVSISARSQTKFVRRLAEAGLPVLHVFMAAPDPRAHELWREARQIVASCAKGITNDAIVAKYQNKTPQVSPDAEESPLHGTDTLTQGVNVTKDRCAARNAGLWVQVDGRGHCVRYFMSTAGGSKDEALVYVHGDIGGSGKDRTALRRYDGMVTASGLQREAHFWSKIYKGPYISLGRLGVLGSSGHHLEQRRSLHEVRVIMAALDALKDQHGIKRFHAVGQSGGGHTVAALAQMRGDVGCVVMASAAVSVKTLTRDRGVPIGTRTRLAYDPIDFVGTMKHQPGRRMVVISDPDDRKVSFRSQRQFVERVKAAGMPILHVTAAASDDDFHGLSTAGRRLAVDCVNDIDDDALTARYQNKKTSAQRPDNGTEDRP